MKSLRTLNIQGDSNPFFKINCICVKISKYSEITLNFTAAPVLMAPWPTAGL